MRVIIFLGPPGAGKGTLAKYLSEKYTIPWLNIGDELRKKGQTGTDLVDKNVVDKILIDNIRYYTKKSAQLILDGYPRTVEQAQKLKTLENEGLLQIHKVINLELSNTLCEKRLTTRTLCKKCKQNLPPMCVMCLKCKTYEVEKRHDDASLDKIRYRLDVFQEYTLPVKTFLQNSTNMVTLDCNQNISTLQKLLIKSL